MNGVFIAGTDTGVGKTVVSCLLAEGLRRAGLRVAVMKPYAAGSWEDTDALIRAAGGGISRAEATPVFYKRALAPAVRGFPAVRIRGEFARIQKTLRRLAKAADAAVVEGIGGVLCPLGGGLTALDLTARLGLPAWVVARPSLGTLNHTLLTVDALRRRGVPVRRIVVSGHTGRTAAERTNPRLLAQLTGLPVTVLPKLRGRSHRDRLLARWARLFSLPLALFAVLSLSTAPAFAGAADVFWEVSVPVTDLRRDPERGHPAPPPPAIDPLEETQLLKGERVKVLEVRGDWARVEAVDMAYFGGQDRWTGYPGWVERKDFSLVSSTGPAVAGTAWRPADEVLRRKIVSTAREFLELPYFWGGRTAGKGPREGVDCSGLVDLSYRKHGVVLPRNANDQYRRCRPLPLDRLRPADLIFFSRSPDPAKIIHVMIFAGGDDIVESTTKFNAVVSGTMKDRVGKPLREIRAGEKAGDYHVFGGSPFLE